MHPDDMRTYVLMPPPLPGYPDAVAAHELHWLAGLLEGEGSFLVGPPSAPRYPVLALQMTDEDVVARVAAMFGRKLGRWQSRHARERPVFLVRITGAKAVAWMIALHPLMGERRQAQIDRAVASHAPTPTARLDERTARQALHLLATGSSVREVAEQFGTSIWCIYDLRGGRTHRHLPRP
jgi:hypothetical protein